MLEMALFLGACVLVGVAGHFFAEAEDREKAAKAAELVARAKALQADQSLMQALDDRIAANGWYRDALVLQRRAIVAEREVSALKSLLIEKLIDAEDESAAPVRTGRPH